MGGGQEALVTMVEAASSMYETHHVHFDLHNGNVSAFNSSSECAASERTSSAIYAWRDLTNLNAFKWDEQPAMRMRFGLQRKLHSPPSYLPSTRVL